MKLGNFCIFGEVFTNTSQRVGCFSIPKLEKFPNIEFFGGHQSLETIREESSECQSKSRSASNGSQGAKTHSKNSKSSHLNTPAAPTKHVRTKVAKGKAKSCSKILTHSFCHISTLKHWSKSSKIK